MSEASTAAPKTGLIKSLVGIRGVLAAVVVGVHAAPSAIALEPVTQAGWTAFWHAAYPALDIFFVLSGFVVTTGYRRKFAHWPGAGVFGRFLVARLSRFYPVHLTVLAALVAAALIGPTIGVPVPHVGSATDAVRHVLLVQGWGDSDALTWNGPTWSLSAEWFCYLMFPLVVPLVLRFRTPAAVVAGFVGACAIPLTAYTFLGFGDPMITHDAPLFRAVGGFLAGAMLCQLGHVGSRIPALLGRVAGWAVLATILAVAGLYTAGLPPLLVLPLAALAVLGLAQQRGWVDAALGSRPFMWSGEISVTLFLTHVPWLFAAGLVITPANFPGAWGWLGIALLLGGAVGVAQLTLVLVERPGQDLMRRLVRPGQPARPALQPALH